MGHRARRVRRRRRRRDKRSAEAPASLRQTRGRRRRRGGNRGSRVEGRHAAGSLRRLGKSGPQIHQDRRHVVATVLKHCRIGRKEVIKQLLQDTRQIRRLLPESKRKKERRREMKRVQGHTQTDPPARLERKKRRGTERHADTKPRTRERVSFLPTDVSTSLSLYVPICLSLSLYLLLESTPRRQREREREVQMDAPWSQEDLRKSSNSTQRDSFAVPKFSNCIRGRLSI